MLSTLSRSQYVVSCKLRRRSGMQLLCVYSTFSTRHLVPSCSESNIFSTAASIQGGITKCHSCAKTHQYIRCPHCQKGQVWKNSDYIPGSAVSCCSCKQSFAQMCCPHCKKSNFWMNPLNTTIGFVCCECKKDMCKTSTPSESLRREKTDLKNDRKPPAVSLDQMQRSLTQLSLHQSRERSSSVARSATDQLTRHNPRSASAHPKKTLVCNYFLECKEYVKHLSWSLSFFDKRHDRCYCANCYPKHLSDTLRVAEANYVVPRGWAGFGLGVDPFRDDNLWNTCIVVYHGTTPIAAQSILTHRQFLLPCDCLIDGTKLAIRPGHIPGKVHVYTSPSIRYASLTVYSPVNSFTSPRTGKHYNAQLVLQCQSKNQTHSPFKVKQLDGVLNVSVISFLMNP